MAGFKTHITFSTMIGCGYGAFGALHYQLPLETACVAGGLCGLSGMLPDIDSDSGVPLRETLSAAAAVVPMLLVDRLQSMGLTYDGMVLTAGAIYGFVRFGLGKLIAHYTVHRGMFHSLPAAFTFAGAAFLLCGCMDYNLRIFKAGGVFLGFMSHLLLDEIYSFEWTGGRWRIKSSFGTAIKLWGVDPWANLSAYTKLFIIAGMILSEGSVMQRLQVQNPELAKRLAPYQMRIHNLEQRIESAGQRVAIGPGPFVLPQQREQPTYIPGGFQQHPYAAPGGGFIPNRSDGQQQVTPYGQAPAAQIPPYGYQQQPAPQQDQNLYDTARRLWQGVTE